MNSYPEIAQLSGLLLEESYVLDIEARPGLVRFELDIVLTPEHPQYLSPSAEEQHCFRRGRMEFLRVRRVVWADQGAPPARDAAGEVDFGNIDSFTWNDLGYELEGSWGRMEVQAEEVVLDQ